MTKCTIARIIRNTTYIIEKSSINRQQIPPTHPEMATVNTTIQQFNKIWGKCINFITIPIIERTIPNGGQINEIIAYIKNIPIDITIVLANHIIDATTKSPIKITAPNGGKTTNNIEYIANIHVYVLKTHLIADTIQAPPYKTKNASKGIIYVATG